MYLSKFQKCICLNSKMYLLQKNMGPDKILQLTTCLLSGDGFDTLEPQRDVIDTSPEIKCSHFDQDEGQDDAKLGSKCSELESSEGDCGNSR